MKTSLEDVPEPTQPRTNIQPGRLLCLLDVGEMTDHELRREKDGSLEDSEMSLRWCGDAWYMAKEQVDIRELEEPHRLSAASTPEKKECQGTKFCLIGRYSKMLDLIHNLFSYMGMARVYLISHDFMGCVFHWGSSL